MRKISVPYGSRSQKAVIGDDIELQVIDVEKIPVEKSADQMLRDGMDHAIGSAKLDDLVEPDNRTLIVVNDHTQPEAPRASSNHPYHPRRGAMTW